MEFVYSWASLTLEMKPWKCLTIAMDHSTYKRTHKISFHSYYCFPLIFLLKGKGIFSANIIVPITHSSPPVTLFSWVPKKCLDTYLKSLQIESAEISCFLINLWNNMFLTSLFLWSLPCKAIFMELEYVSNTKSETLSTM